MTEEARIEVLMERMGLVEKKPTVVVPPKPKPLPLPVRIRAIGHPDGFVEDTSSQSSMRNHTGNYRFKYPITAEVIRSMTFADLDWVRQASREKIMRGIIDCVLLGEEKFDLAFGGWFPRSDQFGVSPLRPGDIKNPYSPDEFVLMYGWYENIDRPNAYTLEVRPNGNASMPSFTPQWNRDNPGFSLLPEPIIIEPRSGVELNKDSIGSTMRVPNETTTILGYYFATLARLISRRW